VSAYFRPRDEASSSPKPAQKQRPLPISVAELKQRGGRLETEITPNGVVTFAFLSNKRYYLSKKGALWYTSVPPPAACHSCDAFHWFWECPQAVETATPHTF
jgi:hypothetical protein